MSPSFPSVERRRLVLALRVMSMVAAAAAVPGIEGCAAPVLDGPLESDADDTGVRLSHGYALLLDLLDDEVRVDGILAIKSPRPGVADLLRHIALEAKVNREHLQPLLAESPVIDRAATALPLIERDTRRRIEIAETPGLLMAGGRNFETRMLLTQQKAAQYAAALCRSLATADPNRRRADLLTVMAHHWQGLEGEIRSWITVVETAPPAAPETGD